KKFNDLGVMYATSIINDFTDDEATYLWRLGSVRTNVNNYKEGTYSLFDLSYSSAKGGYPILDEIDFEFYEMWGFNILETRSPNIINNPNYKVFKDSVTREDIELLERRKYLMTYHNRNLRDSLINTKYLINRQPI